MSSELGERRRREVVTVVRVGLLLFVLAWLFGPYELRASVPVWLAFVVALGLELQFFLGGRRAGAGGSPRPDRLPQAADLDRYGFGEPGDEVLLVRHRDEELWIPYAEGDDVEELVAAARADADRERLENEAAVDAGTVHGRERRLGLPLRSLLAGLAVVGALATAVWFVDARSGWNGLDDEERAAAAARLSSEASYLAGKPVAIRCDDAGEHVGAVQHADGVAVVGGRLAYLTPDRCYDLYRLSADGEVRFSQTARSLAVLAHEVWHLRGVRDEGTTECYALQAGVDLGRRLGLSEETARRMMRQQLAENALRAGASARYRVPPSCRDGGPLDLDPRSSVFP